jgi:hypothetical protein
LLGRRASGIDVDPLAVMVAAAKTARYDPVVISRAAARLDRRLDQWDRGVKAYEQLAFCDLGDRPYRRELTDLAAWIPAVPNLSHWFRRYVVIDLARIRREIHAMRVDSATRRLLLVLFASIIRNASNADPVPVSGLEVTAHMRLREAEGRIVDPFSLLRKALSQGISAAGDWSQALATRPEPAIAQGDATRLSQVRGAPRRIDAVITSPPYHNAVDYYRRHQLEMYWLGLTRSHAERLELLPQYIGRPRVKKSHPLLSMALEAGPLVREWIATIEAHDDRRALDFRHYVQAMRLVLDGLAPRMPPKAPLVLVVGHSAWNGDEIPTAAVFAELASRDFSFDDLLWYPVRNRYMSYTRKNGASIDREFVLVLRRRRSRTSP